MTRATKIVIGVIILAVIGVGFLAVREGGGPGVMVRVEAVAERDLVQTVTASGWVRPRRAVDVQADIMGRVTHLAIDEGDAVERGQLLLRIDPTEYEAAVSRAQAGVAESLARQAQSRANLLQAERALERERSLAERDSTLVSRQALEEIETEVAVQRELLNAAGHTVAQSRAALREAEDRLNKTSIRAPIDGIVTRLNVEEGETAIVGTMNNPGSLLLTVSDLSIMEAVVRVDETDLPELTLGDSAAVQIDAYPRQRFTGQVTRISHSSIEGPQQTGSAPSAAQAVDFEIIITLTDPPEVLRPDLSATADIVTATSEGTLAIPIIALTVREEPAGEALALEDSAAREAADAAVREDQEGVFTVRDGKAVFVPVEIGITGAEHFEVLNGLGAGDSIVAGPYEAIRNLTDGDPVRYPSIASERSDDEEAA